MVQQHYRFPVLRLQTSDPVCKQSALSSTRSSRHHYRSEPPFSQRRVQCAKVAASAEIHSKPDRPISFVPAPFQHERIRHFRFRIGLFNERPEIVSHAQGQLLGVPVIFHNRKPASPNALFQCCQPRLVIGALAAVNASPAERPFWIAKVKEGAPGHARVIQHAIKYLQFSDTFASTVLINPWLLLDQREIVIRAFGHPAIALSQKTHEKWSGAIDLSQADG